MRVEKNNGHEEFMLNGVKYIALIPRKTAPQLQNFRGKMSAANSGRQRQK